MRKLHMSTGAWIFATAVTVAGITAPSVYAAATSTVAIGNTANSKTATVTSSGQLLTVTVDPKSMVRGTGYLSSSQNCWSVYTPPAGKALVVTSVTYTVAYATEGVNNSMYLTNANCSAFYDVAYSDHATDTMFHPFPTGLPLASLGVYVLPSYGENTENDVAFTGYLGPATSLPTATPQGVVPAAPPERQQRLSSHSR